MSFSLVPGAEVTIQTTIENVKFFGKVDKVKDGVLVLSPRSDGPKPSGRTIRCIEIVLDEVLAVTYF